ncbi:MULTISPECIES: hypothetical protein [Clostridium]|uniref:hypothetical protein n=1 Tax=Clostridium TaxID=1485 RepID=UPI00111201BD|nr:MULTISPECIES: hypothetical protein [Clostridium]
MKIAPISAATETRQDLKHHGRNNDFQNILKKLEDEVDIDGDNVYNVETSNVVCDLDNIYHITLKRLLY